MEICSVSDCIARSPEGWIDRWLHNEWGFFNTQVDAQLVPPSGSDGFAVFAYRLFLLSSPTARLNAWRSVTSSRASASRFQVTRLRRGRQDMQRVFRMFASVVQRH